MARVLIVGGGCRGRALAAGMVRGGHVVRVTTRTEASRAAIERAGAECWIGTPQRLATLRGALEGVALACWLLAGATGEPAELRALHGSRLELFVRQLIDTPVRGVIYDAGPGAVPDQMLSGGAELVRSLAASNSIPTRVLTGAAGEDEATWLARASGAIEALLGG